MTECADCLRPIKDRFLLKVLGKDWHPSCVRCHGCRKQLDEKCFYKEGKMYCKDCFYRCFGPKCGGCGEAIHYQDFVRKARDKVYHLRCFTCSVCSKQLSTGEVLYLQPGEDTLICKDDYLRTHQDMSFSDDDEDCEEGSSMGTGGGGGPGGPMGFGDHGGPGGVGMGATPPHMTPTGAHSDTLSSHSLTPTPNKYEANNNSLAPTGPAPNLGPDGKDLMAQQGLRGPPGMIGGPGGYLGGPGVDDDDDDDLCLKGEDGENKSPDDDGPGGKRRGPRTTIKAKQLEVLKTAFSQTPKPTRHIREQLAKETGLSMRVIQVWFQNKRSKERRMKQMTSMVGGRAFFPGKGGRRGFPMIGDDFGYPFGPPPGAGPPHDPKGPPFHDGGFPGGPYPQGFGPPPPPDGFFPPGPPMGFPMGGPPPPGPPGPSMDQPLPMGHPPPPPLSGPGMNGHDGGPFNGGPEGPPGPPGPNNASSGAGGPDDFTTLTDLPPSSASRPSPDFTQNSGGSGPAPPGNGSSSQPPPGGPQGDNSAGGPGSDQPLVW